MISLANQIELRQLRYFMVLAEELHFGKAAERLYISQSALSQQIKSLEDSLGVELFERSNKKVRLSQFGLMFQADATIVLQKLNSGLENLELLKNGQTGKITIGFVSSSMHIILPPLLLKFNQKYPNIHFQLEELNNVEQFEALSSDKLDIAFVRSRNISEKMNLKSIYKENYALILPENHYLREENFDNIAQLEAENFIISPDKSSSLYYNEIVDICAKYRFMPKATHRSNHTRTIFTLVENGLGVSIVPLSLAKKSRAKIRYIELTDIGVQTELFIAWKRDVKNPSLPYFLEILSEELTVE